MKIAYAYRRNAFYPWHRDSGPQLPPAEVRGPWLAAVRAAGFQGIELGAEDVAAIARAAQRPVEAAARELRQELEDAGVPCAAVRGGGGVAAPRVAATNRRRLQQGVEVAAWIGAGLLNTTLTTPATAPVGPGGGKGERVSQGGSRTATLDAYARSAEAMREVADYAAGLGVEISVEVHQNSIVDNSWSALHLLDLVDRPNVGINPDLGNVYWTYEIPEESCEAAIVALAPRAKYWHCKNLVRVHVPDLQRSLFVFAPLQDGEIDYRFAISAMVDAGYRGWLAVEGVRYGDQLYKDGRSVAYVREVLRGLGAHEE